jgi:hypothetical protein
MAVILEIEQNIETNPNLFTIDDTTKLEEVEARLESRYHKISSPNSYKFYLSVYVFS